MAGATINLSESSASGSRIVGKIVWEATTDTAANASKNVTAKIYVRKYNPDLTLTIPTSGTWSYELTINGNKATGSISKDVLLDWVLIATHKVSSIAHNGDGSKSITISGSVTAPSATSFAGHTTKGSGTAKLDTIPRASTITSAAETVLGNYCNVRWTPLTSTFRYKLKFVIGSWSAWSSIIYPGSTAAYTYRAIMQMDIAKQILNGPEGTMTVTLYTYSDSNATAQVGSADTETFKVIVPDNSDTKPSVAMSLQPEGNLPSAFAGLYIQGVTKVKANLQGAGKYNAGIAAHTLHVEGKNYGYAEGYVSDFLTDPGTQQIIGYARDDRGFLGSTSQDINVIAYTRPKIKNVSAERCDAYGTLKEDGTYLRITATRDYSPVMVDGVQKNFCAIQYRVTDENGSEVQAVTTILAREGTNTDTITTGALLGGKLAVNKTYTVEVQAADDISVPTPATIVVPTESVYWHRDGKLGSLGLGQYVDKPNTLAVAWDTELNGSLSVGGNPVQDFPTEYAVVDMQNSGSVDRWQCRKYASGIMEAWGKFSRTFQWDGTSPTFYCKNAPSIMLPNSGDFKFTGIDGISVVPSSSGVIFVSVTTTSTMDNLVFGGGRLYGGNTDLSVTLYVRVIGKT